MMSLGTSEVFFTPLTVLRRDIIVAADVQRKRLDAAKVTAAAQHVIVQRHHGVVGAIASLLYDMILRHESNASALADARLRSRGASRSNVMVAFTRFLRGFHGKYGGALIGVEKRRQLVIALLIVVIRTCWSESFFIVANTQLFIAAKDRCLKYRIVE